MVRIQIHIMPRKRKEEQLKGVIIITSCRILDGSVNAYLPSSDSAITSPLGGHIAIGGCAWVSVCGHRDLMGGEGIRGVRQQCSG